MRGTAVCTTEITIPLKQMTTTHDLCCTLPLPSSHVNAKLRFRSLSKATAFSDFR